MKLSKLDRLIMSNQYRILEKLIPEEAEYYERNRKAIEEGYTLHYEQLTEFLYDELAEEQCKEVLDILDMYRALTFSFQRLEDKTGIKEYYIKFPGFDGNDELESKMMGYTRYFINDLNRFDELRDDSRFPDYNSHCKMLGIYRRMLEEWKRSGNKHDLSKEEIIKIINAGRRM